MLRGASLSRVDTKNIGLTRRFRLFRTDPSLAACRGAVRDTNAALFGLLVHTEPLLSSLNEIDVKSEPRSEYGQVSCCSPLDMIADIA